MNGQAQQTAPVTRQANPAMVMNAQLDAAEVLAQKAAAATSAAEARDFAGASLQLAQAVALLDPSRVQGGDDPAALKDSLPDQAATRDTDRDGKVGEK